MTPIPQGFLIMKNKWNLLNFIFILFILPLSVVRAETNSFEPLQEMVIEAKKADPRVVILKNYLAKFNSPLEDSATDFVEAADKYQVDWKLVAAIAGVESTFGKFTPGGYNCWGWGVYGDQALGFKSYKDGIYTVTEGLRKNYIDKGLTKPLAINRVYAASPTWGVKVNYFINDIEKFAEENPIKDDLFAKEHQIFKPSAQLAQNTSTLRLYP